RVEASPAQAIDGLVLGGLHEPRDRVVRGSAARPLLDRGGERFLQGLLREREVPEPADEGGYDRSRFAPVEGLDLVAGHGSSGVDVQRRRSTIGWNETRREKVMSYLLLIMEDRDRRRKRAAGVGRRECERMTRFAEGLKARGICKA